jgi:hypothetical protein
MSGGLAFLASWWAAERLWRHGQGVPLRSAVEVLFLYCGILLTVGSVGFVISRRCPRDTQVTGVSATSAHIQAFASYLVIAVVAVWGSCVVAARLSLDALPQVPLLITLSAISGALYSGYRYWIREHGDYLAWESANYVRLEQLSQYADSSRSLEAVHTDYLTKLRRHLQLQHVLVGAVLSLSIAMPFACIALAVEKFTKIDWTGVSRVASSTG